MKKLLSLIMTVAMVISLVPSVITNAEEISSETVRVSVTADVALDGSSTTSYGKTNLGDQTAMFFNRSKADQAWSAPLLFKTDFSNLNLDEGQVIEKVEFCMYSIAEGSKNSGFTGYVDIYTASTEWEELSTVLLDWCDDKNDTGNVKYPDIISKNPDDLYWWDITTAPDASVSTQFVSFSGSDTAPKLITLDITNAFKSAYPSGVVQSDDEFSWMTAIRKDGGYRYATIASKEHNDSAVHPYLKITVGNKPTMYVTEYETPINAQSMFALSTSNAIDTYSVSVNGVPVVSGVSVNGTDISVDYPWVIGEEYTVVVNATDTFGQSSPESTYTFTVADSYVFPITHDTTLHAYNNSSIPGGYGAEIWGDFEYIELRCPTKTTSRAIGVMRTDALAGLSEQINSGKLIDKVELCAYIAPGSYAKNTTMRFFPASTSWDESTMYMTKWCNENYVPNLTWDVFFGGFDDDAVPSDTVAYNYPAVSADGDYVPVTFDITNTFKNALSEGVVADSVFSFMIAPAETGSYEYVNLASSEASQYAPTIKVTLKEKKYETESTTDFTGYGYFISSTGSKTLSGTGDTAYYFPADSGSYVNSGVAAYTIPLPAVENGKYLESFKMTFCRASSSSTQDYSPHINVYRYIPEGEVDLSTLKFADVAQYAVKENRTGSVRATGKVALRAGTVEGDFAHAYFEHEADLTEYAYECMKAGKTEMIVLMNCDYAFKFCVTRGQIDGSMSQSEQGSKYIATIASNPEITLADSDITVGGSIVESSEFKFRTQLTDDAVSFAKLYKGSEPVENAVFTLTPSKTKIVLAPITLEENESYRAVLLSGVQDLFGNTSEEEIELASFVTVNNLIIAVPKIVAGDFDVQNGDFDTVTEITSDVASGSEIKAITQITNNTNKNDEIFVVIAAYKGNDVKELKMVDVGSIGITMKATRIYSSEAITIDSDCDTIKAFVWAENKIVPLSMSKVVTIK